MSRERPGYPDRPDRRTPTPDEDPSTQLSFLLPEDALAIHLVQRFLAEVRTQYAYGQRREPFHGPRLQAPEDVFALMRGDMETLRQEQLRVLTVTTKNHVIGTHLIYQGTISGTPVRLAEVFRPAIVESAAGIIAVHNHPSGDPAPSPDDIRLSRSMATAGRLLDIEAVDHIVIGLGRFVSLRERGLMEAWAALPSEGGDPM